MKRNFVLGALLAVTLAAAFGDAEWAAAQQNQSTVAIDPDDVGGRVVSAKGAEAGVWVVAETTDLATKFARIVVTDDQGRYAGPRPSARHVSSLRARLWLARFAAAGGQTRATA